MFEETYWLKEETYWLKKQRLQLNWGITPLGNDRDEICPDSTTIGR
jgi:hypothetical protein